MASSPAHPVAAASPPVPSVAAGVGLGALAFALFTVMDTAPAAPFQYSQMIWAILLGFVIWGDLPEPARLLGAAIVAASGLFILHRETRLGRRPTASLHPNAGTTRTG